MPIYDIKHKETGEIKEVMKSISAMETFLKENPDWNIHIAQSASLGDPTRLTATKKVDGGFNDVITKIHHRTAGSALDRTSNYVR